MRISGRIAVPWGDYQRSIATADQVPADAWLVRNDAGNVTIVSANDDYLGFIDSLSGDVTVWGRQ